jgi:hypothetical protein
VNPVASFCAEEICPKAKDSSVQRRVKKMRRELPEPDHSALISTALLKTSTLYEVMRRYAPVHERTDNKDY